MMKWCNKKIHSKMVKVYVEHCISFIKNGHLFQQGKIKLTFQYVIKHESCWMTVNKGLNVRF